MVGLAVPGWTPQSMVQFPFLSHWLWKKLDSNCFIAELDQSNIAGDQPRKFHWFQFSLRKLSTWLQAQLLNDQKLAYVGQNFAFSMLKSTPAWRKKVCHRRCWQCWLIWAMNCLLLIKMSRTGGQECWWPPMALISDGASSPPKWHWPSPVTAPWMQFWLSSSSSSSSQGPLYVILSSWHQKSPFLTYPPRRRRPSQPSSKDSVQWLLAWPSPVAAVLVHF